MIFLLLHITLLIYFFIFENKFFLLKFICRDLAPFEKRAIVLTVERNISSIGRRTSEKESESVATSITTDTMASVFAEDFASILISQFAVEVTLLGPSTGQNRRYCVFFSHLKTL